MSDTQAFHQAIANADALGRDGRWSEAGALYARAATFAMEHQQLDVAREVWGVAGEAFRRADEPVDASRALRLALSIPGGEAAAVAHRRVAWSAVLSELGEYRAARDQNEAAAQVPGARAMALDGQFSVELAVGTRSSLDTLLDQLEDERSRAFRGAQLDRLHGRLSVADDALARLERSMADNPAGLGGIRAERAELAALRGRAQDAADAWQASFDDHLSAGRTSLAWRAEAGRVRCLLEAGIQPFGERLSEGLAWAEGRGMRVLAIDLRIPLGSLRRDARMLAQTAQEARSLGMLRRSGRAILARAGLLAGPARLAEAQAAADLLIDDAPWWLRARLLHAEALASVAPSSGASAAARLITPLRAAGMEPELTRARALEA